MRGNWKAWAVAALVAAGVTAGAALTPQAQGDGPRAPILAQTQAHRQAVWHMQRLLLRPLSKTRYTDRRPHASEAYRLWVRDLWAGRRAALQAAYDKAFGTGVWDSLAVCETSGNWQHYNSTYQGGLGFYHGSWDAYRPRGWPHDAHLATREEQIVVGQLILQDVGWGAWPACSIRLGLR